MSREKFITVWLGVKNIKEFCDFSNHMKICYWWRNLHSFLSHKNSDSLILNKFDKVRDFIWVYCSVRVHVNEKKSKEKLKLEKFLFSRRKGENFHRNLHIYLKSGEKLVQEGKWESVSKALKKAEKEKKGKILESLRYVHISDTTYSTLNSKKGTKLKSFQSICLVNSKSSFSKSMNNSRGEKICTFILMAVHFIHRKKKVEYFRVSFMSRSFRLHQSSHWAGTAKHYFMSLWASSS